MYHKCCLISMSGRFFVPTSGLVVPGSSYGVNIPCILACLTKCTHIESLKLLFSLLWTISCKAFMIIFLLSTVNKFDLVTYILSIFPNRKGSFKRHKSCCLKQNMVTSPTLGMKGVSK